MKKKDTDNTDTNNNGKNKVGVGKVVTGLVVGSVLGATIGLLIVPKTAVGNLLSPIMKSSESHRPLVSRIFLIKRQHEYD